MKVSPSQDMVAYVVDYKGDELYDIVVKQIGAGTGSTVVEKVAEVG